MFFPNEIPDYVENMARQTYAIRKAYNLLGFRDPLESARFRSATYIDINLVNQSRMVVAQPLPASMEEMQSRVFSQNFPYDFWSRLASFMDEADRSMQLPYDLRSATYTDGSAIFKDDLVRGLPFLSVVMQSLDAEDGIVASLNGWPEYDWKGNQTSAVFNTRILKVIQRAVRRSGVRNNEIDAFLAIE